MAKKPKRRQDYITLYKKELHTTLMAAQDKYQQFLPHYLYLKKNQILLWNVDYYGDVPSSNKQLRAQKKYEEKQLKAQELYKTFEDFTKPAHYNQITKDFYEILREEEDPEKFDDHFRDVCRLLKEEQQEMNTAYMAYVVYIRDMIRDVQLKKEDELRKKSKMEENVMDDYNTAEYLADHRLDIAGEIFESYDNGEIDIRERHILMDELAEECAYADNFVDRMVHNLNAYLENDMDVLELDRHLYRESMENPEKYETFLGEDIHKHFGQMQTVLTESVLDRKLDYDTARDHSRTVDYLYQECLYQQYGFLWDEGAPDVFEEAKKEAVKIYKEMPLKKAKKEILAPKGKVHPDPAIGVLVNVLSTPLQAPISGAKAKKILKFYEKQNPNLVPYRSLKIEKTSIKRNAKNTDLFRAAGIRDDAVRSLTTLTAYHKKQEVFTAHLFTDRSGKGLKYTFKGTGADVSYYKAALMMLYVKKITPEVKSFCKMVMNKYGKADMGVTKLKQPVPKEMRKAITESAINAKLEELYEADVISLEDRERLRLESRRKMG